ncbi:hypothetical protein ACFQ07_01595 [Actinomadura adrarensis]|uniref:Uncharacterized protein n=1 Tax=Actinomadura adrarensis TaxID=1819600 RepID=A0ABW3CB73_9ACTN
MLQTGQIYEEFPQLEGKEIKVRLVCMDDPENDPDLMELLVSGSRLFAKHGADFAVEVVPRQFIEGPNS